jgi:cytochrome c-type biogenesis protein CcmH/NrfF
LWFGPVIAFIVGMFYAVRFFRSQKVAEDAGELSSDEVERLRSLQSELDASGKGDSE